MAFTFLLGSIVYSRCSLKTIVQLMSPVLKFPGTFLCRRISFYCPSKLFKSTRQRITPRQKHAGL